MPRQWFRGRRRQGRVFKHVAEGVCQQKASDVAQPQAVAREQFGPQRGGDLVAHGNLRREH